MGKFVILILTGIFTILVLLLVVGKRDQHDIQFIPSPVATDDVVPMPLVPPLAIDEPIVRQTTPIAQRDEKYFWYLSSTVAVRTNKGMGSGTIIYYDSTTSEAYVASCGHLWEDSKTASELRQNPEHCYIEAFYNQYKLDKKKKYVGTILFRNFVWGQDVSLIKFTADWSPNVFSIAPLTYKLRTETTYHSLGCDYDSEVAHYGVEIIRYDQMLVTQYNSPRPGRSGGGLLTTEGYYIGTCSATDDMRGRGIGHGYFTPLRAIHTVYTSNGYDWLLKQPVHRLDQILIRDYTNPGKRPERDLLPFPRSKRGILLH